MAALGEGYAQWVLDNLGASLVVPLVDGELTPYPAHNEPGIVMLRNGTSPVDGDYRPAPYFDGVREGDSRIRFVETDVNGPLHAAVRHDKGGYMIFGKYPDPAVYNDLTRKQYVAMRFGSDNDQEAVNRREDQKFRWQYWIGGVNQMVESNPPNPLGGSGAPKWHSVSQSWADGNNGGEMRALFNGVLQGSVPVTQVSTYGAAAPFIEINIGQDSFRRRNLFHGWEAFLILWNEVPADSVFLQAHEAALDGV